MANKLYTLIIIVFMMISCTNKTDTANSLSIILSDDWEFRQVGTEKWLPASVPGSVHTDLLNNGQIEDPYYRLNEKKLQWIDKADWEYRTSFEIDPDFYTNENVGLVFHGLDTYSKVSLNGTEILSTDNMFRTWEIDVKKYLRPGNNELSVILESPTRKGMEKLKEFGFQLAADNDQSENGEMGTDRVSPYVRKAPYHFGWDWGPRLVTSGIWKPVELIGWNKGRILDIQITTKYLSGDHAELIAKLEIEVNEDGEYIVDMEGAGVPGAGVPFNLKKGINLVEVPIIIDKPNLWQPNGYGTQEFYHFDFSLSNNKELLDKKNASTGLRTVRLLQDADPDNSGKSFYFEVNGKPVFAKGANYIPNDIFLTRVTPDKYEYIVKSAAEANMNMLRVWGGGIYEQDIFYDLCDRYGIMVWQDFMFACAMYPGNDEFLESVRQEAADNVKRLRNHPCIVLWCGNNEIEAAWGPYDENRGWGWKQRYNAEQREIIWKAYDTLFHKILPEVILKEDPSRPYWHSSPSAGMGQLASYETASGDIHYWGVWHGLHPISDFRKYRSRFMSEYGFQSFPEFNSVRKYAIREDYDIESPVMTAHQRSGIGNLRIRQYMEQDYNVPKDFEEFLYVGQLLQAEAIKTAIEAHRSDMPYCMGSLYWQLNDCWPVASWSGIDYYGKWKALHYFVKEAFKPVILVSYEDGDSLHIKVVSDAHLSDDWKLVVKLIDFNGALIFQGTPALGTPAPGYSIPVLQLLKGVDPASVVLVSELLNGQEVFDRSLHYFVKLKDLKLQDPQIDFAIKENKDEYVVTLKSDLLAKNVFLYCNDLEEQFSDNFFDILPGEEIAVTLPKTYNSSEKIESLRLLHLYQTSRAPQKH